MGIVQKDALRTSIVQYLGLVLGYFNKGFLFILLLTTEEIGLINLILAVSMLFAQFANLGSYNTIWRFFPFLENKERNHHGFLSFNLLVALTGGLFITLLLLIFSPWIIEYYSIKSKSFADYFFWVIPCGFGILVHTLLDGYMRAIHKSVFSIFVNDVALRVVTSLVLAVYAFDFLSFRNLVVTICIIQLLPALMVIAYMRVIGEWKVSLKSITISKRLKKILVQYSGFAYLNSIGASLVLSIDALMVAGMIGLSATGVYTTIIYITRALVIPYGSIMRVSSPIIPKLWKERNMPAMQTLYTKVSSVALIIGLFLFLCAWVNRTALFNLFPPEFEEGVYVFLFIMIGKLIDMYFGLNGIILMTSKKYKYDMIFTGFLLILVFVLNLWLIPIWGMVGAAISTAIALLLYNVARLVFVWVNFKMHPFKWTQLLVILLFTGVVGITELLIPEISNVWLGLTVNTAVVTLLFPVVIYAFKIEPEIGNYINKGAAVFKSKLGKKKS